MSDYTEKKTLPACPVETTLTLIGDKWKVLTASEEIYSSSRYPKFFII